MEDYKKFTYFLLDQLRRRRWTAMFVTWGFCCVGWFAVALLPNRYVSEARFHIDTTSMLTPLLKGISVNSDDQTADQQVAIMQRTLTSRPNLSRVVEMTDMDKKVRSPGALQDLVSSLEDRISITSQGTNLFLVEYTDNSPKMAKDVVQALLSIMVENSAGGARSDIKSARTFIDTQIETYEEQLKAAEQRLADFKVANLQYLSSSSQTFAVRMAEAEQTLKGAKFDSDDAAGDLDRLQRQLSSTPRYLSIDSAPQVVIGEGFSGSLEQRIGALRARLDSLKLQFTDKYPDVLNAQSALNALLVEKKSQDSKPRTEEQASGTFRAQVPNEIFTQLSLKVAEASGRAATARRKLFDSQSNFDALGALATVAPKVEAQLSDLNRDYDALRGSYDALVKRRESARIADAADLTAEPIHFRMVAAPELPAHPSGPKRTLLNILVLLVGIIAGSATVVVLAKIKDCVAAAEDLAVFIETRVLGCVSLVPLTPHNFIAKRRFDRFGYAAVGLGVMFCAVLISRPVITEFNSSGIWNFL